MIRSNTFKPHMRSPLQIDTQVLAVTNATQSLAVVPGTVLRLVNTHATETSAINFGYGSCAAVMATDMLIPAATTIFVEVPTEADTMAIIGTGNHNVRMTRGE